MDSQGCTMTVQLRTDGDFQDLLVLMDLKR